MITSVEALNYRCLRYVQRPLKPFHVLVGPNASGKTTFLDVIGFLQDLVLYGDLADAVEERTPNPRELFFQGQGGRLELAVEAQIPDNLRELTFRPDLDTIRYQVALDDEGDQGQFELKAETLLLQKATKSIPAQPAIFPMPPLPPNSLQAGIHGSHNKVVLNKLPGGNDNFYSETYRRSAGGWVPAIKLGPRRSALGNLPEDKDNFPVATWFRDYLTVGVQQFFLNSRAIRRPSPPTRIGEFWPDGSNLPWVVSRLRRENPKQHKAWIAHLQTALRDLTDITTVERPEDRHCYMVYQYAGGMNVPSWLVSDGTLRLTALTLPAYLTDYRGIYLIEEPENGIHPSAVATAYDSLSSMYNSQVLLATHSPVVLNTARADDVLCFAKSDDGATDIVLGSEHPMLRDWQGQVDLGTLLASGVLG